MSRVTAKLVCALFQSIITVPVPGNGEPNIQETRTVPVPGSRERNIQGTTQGLDSELALVGKG